MSGLPQSGIVHSFRHSHALAPLVPDGLQIEMETSTLVRGSSSLVRDALLKVVKPLRAVGDIHHALVISAPFCVFVGRG